METKMVERQIATYRDAYECEGLKRIIKENLKKLWDASEKESQAEEWTENIYAAFTVFEEKIQRLTPVKHLSRFLNTLNSENRQNFLAEMRQLHPTLQQTLAGHLFAWLNDYAVNYLPDDRNRASIEYSRKILEAFKEAMGEPEFKTKFPFI